MEELGNSRNRDIERSEEVRDIIDRMPTSWAKWVSLCVGILIGIVFLLSYLIEYPDTVTGSISMTAENAPVRIVVKVDGRLILLRGNHTKVQKDDVIGYIANGANYKHVLQLDKYLNSKELKVLSYPPKDLNIGELSNSYNTFVLAYTKYKRVMKSDIRVVMRSEIKSKIRSDKDLVGNIDKATELKSKVLALANDQLKKDSLVLAQKGMSKVDFDQQYSNNLSLKEAIVNEQNNKLSKLSDIRESELETQRSLLEEHNEKAQALDEYVASCNELKNAIRLWKEKYLLCAPMDGSVEYLGFWRNNNFVTNNSEIFSIIPVKNKVIGEVIMPSLGAGKVKVGQEVNVKLNKFPYDEYGLLKGEVSSISRSSNYTRTAEGEIDTYLVTVKFPHRLRTNFGLVLPIDFDTKGVAEIITKPKRLIERLFDNLKAQKTK